MAAQNTYNVSPTDPPIGIDTDALGTRIAAFCKAQNITTDAQWTTAVTQAFNGTNASGLSASTRTFMVEFFSKLIKIG